MQITVLVYVCLFVLCVEYKQAYVLFFGHTEFYAWEMMRVKMCKGILLLEQ